MVLELRIDKLVQGGDGFARLPDGRACFVEGALSGELCRVEILRDKKDFARGRAIEILEKSPDRVQPKCLLCGKCGGCSMQHLSSEKQALYYESVSRENFRRIAHAELPENFKVHTGPAWGYRNRARLMLKRRKDGKIVYGFREQERNDVIAFESCPVLTPAINNFLKKNAESIYAKMLESKADFEKKFKKSKLPVPDLNLFDNGKGEISYFYKGMSATDYEKHSKNKVDVAGYTIQSDASVFFQSNLSLLPQLVRSVQEAVDEGIKGGAASDEWLIDLYSGVGLFAVVLGDRFKRITTVERNKDCLKHATVNLAGKKNVENVSAPAEDWLSKNVIDVPATLIVDPPRTGLLPEALDAVVKSSVNRMIYVSCDPVTFARDFVKFREAGFSLKSSEGFAFYPHTPHLEMMSVLSR